MKHPFLIGSITLAGLFVAYEVWGRTAGDKAKIGDTVLVDASQLQATPGLQAIFPLLPIGTFVFLLITSIDDSTSPGVVTGRLVQVDFPDHVVNLQNTMLFVKTTRKGILPAQTAPDTRTLPVTQL